ncbi:hypothetical protein WA556_006754, partial [Blastocystis sp. ATCC 50177/Nand II]
MDVDSVLILVKVIGMSLRRGMVLVFIKELAMKNESREELAKRVLMSDYVTERSEKRVVGGKEVEIVMYQGKHCDEYLVREVKSGRCSLFYKGIIQLSWKEVDGVRVGGFTVYEKGKALRSEDWKGLAGKEQRRVENCKNGLELVIEGNGVVYRGGFDDAESMKREGRGMEFDEESGRVLRCGVWKNDELFHIEKEFKSEEVMIEYDIDEGKSNLSLLNRHPVYEGGYVFDKEKREVLRNGDGCEIDINTGIAVREGTWERGELKESVELFDGWYVKKERNDPFDWGLRVADLRVEIHNRNEWENVSKRVTELVIPSKCCNEEEWSVFDVSELKWLKSIEIGDECFENVDEVKLIGMNRLKSVVIGKNCFTKKKNSEGNDPSRHFHLKNCERLRELKMGCCSFSDYSVCDIENVPSLEVIVMGDLDKYSVCFCYASLELKNFPSLKTVLFGDATFYYCSRAVFENLPELTSIQLGYNALYFNYGDESTELIMRNLPKLTSLTTLEGSGTFKYPRSITLEDMPSLTSVVLVKKSAFQYKNDIHTKNITPALDKY